MIGDASSSTTSYGLTIPNQIPSEQDAVALKYLDNFVLLFDLQDAPLEIPRTR